MRCCVCSCCSRLETSQRKFANLYHFVACIFSLTFTAPTAIQDIIKMNWAQQSTKSGRLPNSQPTGLFLILLLLFTLERVDGFRKDKKGSNVDQSLNTWIMNPKMIILTPNVLRNYFPIATVGVYLHTYTSAFLTGISLNHINWYLFISHFMHWFHITMEEVPYTVYYTHCHFTVSCLHVHFLPEAMYSQTYCIALVQSCTYM